MLVRYCCSNDSDDLYKYKSKVHRYPDNTKDDKIIFDSGVWTIDVAERLGKSCDYICCWGYEDVPDDYITDIPITVEQIRKENK